MDPFSSISKNCHPTFQYYVDSFKKSPDSSGDHPLLSLAKMSSNQILDLSDQEIRHCLLFDNEIGHIELMPISDQEEEIKESMQEIEQKQVASNIKEKNPKILNIDQQIEQFEEHQKKEKKKCKRHLRQLKSFADLIYKTIQIHEQLSRDQLFSQLRKTIGKKVTRNSQRRIYDILNVLRGSGLIIYENKHIALSPKVNHSQFLKSNQSEVKEKIKEKRQRVQEIKLQIQHAKQRLHQTQRLIQDNQRNSSIEQPQKNIEFPVTMISTEVVESINYDQNQVAIKLKKQHNIDVSCLDAPSIMRKLEYKRKDGKIQAGDKKQGENC